MLIPKQGVCDHTARGPGSYTVTIPKLLDAISKVCNLPPGWKVRISDGLHFLAKCVGESYDGPIGLREMSDRIGRVLGAEGYRPDSTLSGFDLERVLAAKCGNCVEFSAIYVLLGEILRWRVHAVRLPAHMAVRVYCGEEYCNIETMAPNWPRYTDSDCARRFNLTSREISSGVYLRSLSEQELVAEVIHKVHHDTLSTGAKLSRDVRRDLRWALRSHAKGPDLPNSIGLNAALRGRFGRAEGWFRETLGRDQDCMPALSNLLEMYLARRDDVGVVRAINRYVGEHWPEAGEVRVTRPGYPELVQNVARGYLLGGHYRQARRIFEYIDALIGVGIWPLRDSCVQAYQACLYYLLGEYDKSADASVRCYGDGNPMGAVWAASAWHRAGKDDVAERFVKSAKLQDPFTKGLAEIMCGRGSEEDLRRMSALGAAEINACLAEWWAPVDLERAIEFWKYAVNEGDKRSFVHLRAFRNLKDQCRTRPAL
jgi:hypothetical protein